MSSARVGNAVSVTGTGAVTCCGIGADVLFEHAANAHTGIVDGFGPVHANAVAELRKRYPEAKDATAAVLFAYASIREAMSNARWNTLHTDDGLVLATTAGGVPLWEEITIDFLRGNSDGEKFADSFPNLSLAVALEHLCELLNFRGKTMMIASACSAAAQAIAIGASWILEGKVKRCLVGGTEVLSMLTAEGFRSLQLLSTTPATPFDVDRMGINLSEGAGFLCLEQNRDRADAYISGFGFSTDAYHLVSPHPEGIGCVRAMTQAMKHADIDASDVAWVHAHGTGSKANDLAEGTAIRTVFGENPPWVSSTKYVHGHALGASGAIETVLCVESLKRGTILKTGGLTTPDPEIRVRHAISNITKPFDRMLKNTLGFGGNNAALVLSKTNR